MNYSENLLNVTYLKIDEHMIFRSESFSITNTIKYWSQVINRIETIKGIHIDGIVRVELLGEIKPAGQVAELKYTTYIGTPSTEMKHPCELFENLASLDSVNSNIRGIDFSKCSKLSSISIVNTIDVTYGRGGSALDYLLQLFQNKITTITNLIIIGQRTTLLDISRRMGELKGRFSEIDYLSALITLNLENTEIDKVAAAVNTIKTSIGKKQIEMLFSERSPEGNENNISISSLCGDWKAHIDDHQKHFCVSPTASYNVITCTTE